jgi:hypothetical protein
MTMHNEKDVFVYLTLVSPFEEMEIPSPNNTGGRGTSAF